MIKFSEMERHDKQFFVGAIAVPVLVWFYFNRHKYSAKGMK